VLPAKNVDAKIIIGKKTKNNFNVKSVDIEQHCEVEQ